MVKISFDLLVSKKEARDSNSSIQITRFSIQSKRFYSKSSKLSSKNSLSE